MATKSCLRWDSLLQLTGQLLEGESVLEDLVAETDNKLLALLDRGFTIKRKRSPRNHHKPSSGGGDHRSPNNFNQPAFANNFPENPAADSKPNPNDFKKSAILALPVNPAADSKPNPFIFKNKTSANLALPFKKRWSEFELGESSSCSTTPNNPNSGGGDLRIPNFSQPAFAFPVNPAADSKPNSNNFKKKQSAFPFPAYPAADSKPNPNNFKKTSANLDFPLNPKKSTKKKKRWSEFDLGESSSCSTRPMKKPKHLLYMEEHLIINNIQTTCGLPELAMRRRIIETGGSFPVCVIEKALFRTDVAKVQCRLSVPLGQVSARFLYPDEKERLLAHSNGGIHTTIIQPCLEECKITLALWASNITYVLKNGWREVFEEEDNKLWEGVVIRLWAFRRNSQLCFALERL